MEKFETLGVQKNKKKSINSDHSTLGLKSDLRRGLSKEEEETPSSQLPITHVGSFQHPLSCNFFYHAITEVKALCFNLSNHE